MAVVVGDVSGKGVGAALLMANLQATMRARLPSSPTSRAWCPPRPRDGVRGAARALLTLFLAVLDGRRGRLRYVNAGHNTQFVLRRETAPERLASTGRPPGLYPAAASRSARPLHAGDGLFLFTDGLVEAEDELGEPFGMSRLEASARGALSQDLKALLGQVDAAVRRTGGPLEAADDATMVALRFASGAPAGRA